jgi:hypothetical protein
MFNNNLLMGAASAGSGEPLIEIGNSALFSTSTQSLSDTPSSAGNLRDWTVSFWVYLNSQTAYQMIFSTETSTKFGAFQFNTSNFSFLSHNSTGANHVFQIPTKVFRDIGWYHMVTRCSSTSGDGTVVYDSMNISIWVNGEAQAVTSVPYNTPSGGPRMFSGGVQRIGAAASTTPTYYVAEIVYLDGQKQNADAFGQYDSTGTFWTPKSPDVIKELTFGTNGFYFDNATNPQTDASGNGNNYTNNNTVVTDTHTPTNIEFLMSPINTTDPSNIPVLTDGNRTWSASSASAQTRIGGNIPFPSSGKWIAGVIITELSNGKAFGIWSDRTDGDGFPNFGGFAGWHRTTVLVAYEADGSTVLTSNNWPQGNTQAVGDQCWIAVDIDNSKTFMGYYDLSADTILWYANDAGNDGNPATGDNPFENINCAGMVWAGAAQNSKSFTLVKEEDCPFTIPTGYSFLSTTNIAANITRTKSNLEEYFDTTLYEGNGAGQRVGKFLPFTNAFTVGNGALFNKDNSESLSKTPSGAGSSTTTGTFNVWIKQGQSVSSRGPLIYVDGSGSDFQIELNISGNNKLRVDLSYSAANHVKLSTQAFKDTSQWSMVTCILDTSNGTASERIRLYWNSNRLALTTDNTIDQNQAIIIGSAVEHQIGALETSYFYDGYMSEVVYIDGTALEPSNFGQVDTSTGRWIPKDVSGLTFGTNGFYLNFANSSDVGNDVSGNNNDFTNNNTVVQVGDTPTTNFGTLNVSNQATVTNGNRTNVGASGGGYGNARTGLTFGNEKIFAMLLINDGGSGASVNTGFSVAPDSYVPAGDAGQTGAYANVQTQGTITRVVIGDAKGGTALVLTHSIAVADGDYFTMAVDASSGSVWFGIYDTSAGSHQYLPAVVGGTAGDPANGTLPTVSNLPFNNSQSCIFSTGFQSSSSSTIVFNSADMPMSIPTDYLEFKQDNLATGESYQTAFSWIKNRDATDNHMLFDRVRGIYNDIHSNTQDAEVTNVNTLQRFLNGGVQVGNDVQVNTASESYVAWNWYMGTAGTGSSNTDGTINTTSTLVDTNLGMSISTYTGTGANATIGHGLGVVPEFFMVTRLDSGNDKMIYHSALGATKNLVLNGTNTPTTSITRWNNTEPTSSVISLGTTAAVNGSSATYICYAFAPSQFTSIGSYTGNGNANGVFVPTLNSLGVPIQPAWVMFKSIATASGWGMYDNQRDPFNTMSKDLRADLSNAENIDSSDKVDIVTGGLKMRANHGGTNAASLYVYLAFGTPMIDVDGRIITGF